MTYPLADTVPSRYMVTDRVTKVFIYDHVLVDTATLTASEGKPLDLALGLVGKGEDFGNAGTFPALTIDAADGPFIFSDCVLTVGGTPYNAKSIKLELLNHIDRTRFFNSTTLSSTTNAMDREVKVSLSLPYGDAVALFGSGDAGAGVAVVATFTNGSAVLTLTMSYVDFGKDSPSVKGRQEILLPINGVCYASGTNKELICQLNNGP